MFERDGVWWTCIRHNGRKIQRSLKIPVGRKDHERVARAIESKIRVQLIEEDFFDKPTGCRKNLKDMMDKFMKEHAPRVSCSMQKSYSSCLTHLVPFFGDSNLMSISAKMISQYKVLRTNDGAAPATINRELSMLSKAFNVAINEWEWLKDNPVSRIPKYKENNKRDRWLTENEEEIFLQYCPEWLREIVVFALNTGLRQDELLSLQWSRVSFVRKTVLIQKTKNGMPRTIPLNEISLNVLDKKSGEKVMGVTGIVFCTSHGTKILPSNLRRTFYKVLEKVGIEDFKFHDLRHTFATRLAQRDVDLYKISKLLGHKDIRMTQRYAHHCSDSLRDGVRILEADYVLTTLETKA